MKLPADNGPDRSRQHKQEHIFTREAIHEKHAQDHDGHAEYDAENQQSAFANKLCFPSLALLILL